MNKTLLATALLSALNFQLVEPETVDGLENPPERYQPPEWLPMMPEGLFAGRDGRKYNNTSSQAVIDWIVDNQKDIQIDMSHASELKAPQGEEAPAYGWIKAQASEFKIEGGQLMARVEWNYNGQWKLEDKQVRYYSPVFVVKRDIDEATNAMDIIGITSVGLTNDPNLFVPALNTNSQHQSNHHHQSNHQEKDNPMNEIQLAALRLSLNMSISATPEECIDAVSNLQSTHQTELNNVSGAPDMKDFATRAEFNTMKTRAETAEGAIADQLKLTRTDAIATSLNAALTAGKIIPADREYYEKQCNKEGGLEEFNELMKDKAPVIDADSINLDDKELDKTSTSLNAEEAAMCKQMGISAEKFLAEKTEQLT